MNISELIACLTMILKMQIILGECPNFQGGTAYFKSGKTGNSSMMQNEEWAILDQHFGKFPLLSIFRQLQFPLRYKKL